MLEHEVRAAIRQMHARGAGVRQIARTLDVSRNAVRRALANATAATPSAAQDADVAVRIERIRELLTECAGNRIRVHERLGDEGVHITYSTLTRLMRAHGIGVAVPTRAGQYHFEPGEEMQHDTSPCAATIDGTSRTVHCASLVLCYSRRIYAQCALQWDRFACRVFLNSALRHFGATAARCMVDNSSVVLASGSGRNAIFASEMLALADRFGFVWTAHRVGDANRSARVERPFDYIQRNFFAGRCFHSLDDLNAHLLQWCATVDHKPMQRLGVTRAELFAAEWPALRPVPAFVPDPIRIHHRIVDTEGYVALHTNRYSAPDHAIGHTVVLHESATDVKLYEHDRLLCSHSRLEPGARRRALLPQHQHQARRYERRGEHPLPTEHEITLRAAAPFLVPLIELLRLRTGHQHARHVRKLHRLWIDYPADLLRDAVQTALLYGLSDLDRIERRILQDVAGQLFRNPGDLP